MNSRPILALVFLVTVSGLLIWRAGDDEQFIKAHTPVAALALPAPAPVRVAWSSLPVAPAQPAPQVQVRDADPWPNTLRGVQSGVTADKPAAWRAALAEVLPVLATDRDVQLLVGDMLISKGDPVDGLAWELLACMDCTPVDLGLECVTEGLCDPNLTLIDVRRRDFGEAMVADALVRMEEIKARIAINDPAALAIFTEIDDRRFPKEVGECQQLRTPTPECPPEEILRQTQRAYEQ